MLDELHTYYGRQGADIAVLVRRVRDLCGGDALQCVGTSATLFDLRWGVLIYVHSCSGTPARRIVVRRGGQHHWASWNPSTPAMSPGC